MAGRVPYFHRPPARDCFIGGFPLRSHRSHFTGRKSADLMTSRHRHKEIVNPCFKRAPALAITVTAGGVG
jgi:hypothetical protein